MTTFLPILRDVFGDRLVQERPRMVVMVDDPKDVLQLVELANRHTFRLLILGTGSSFPEAVPIPENVVALMMSRFEPSPVWDEESLTVTVGAGYRIQTLCQALKSAGWEYRFLEAIPRITIGGAIAGCPLTAHTLHNNLRNFILGLNVANAGRHYTQWGGKTVKDVAGLDIASLFIGSGGSIGVILEATLRLVPFSSPLYDAKNRKNIIIHADNPPANPPSDYQKLLNRVFDPQEIFYRVRSLNFSK